MPEPPVEQPDGLIIRSVEETENIAYFWRGFQSFRNNHPDLEQAHLAHFRKQAVQINIDRELPDLAVSDLVDKLIQGTVDISPKALDKQIAVEQLMLFSYGIELARRTFPEATERIDDMPVIIVERKTLGGFGSFGVATDSTGRLVCAASYSHLITPDSDPNHPKTCSKLLTDDQIVKAVMAGVEEFSHFIFLKSATLDTKTAALSEYSQHKTNYIREGLLTNHFDPVTYKSSIMELMAAVWKHKVAKNSLPWKAEELRKEKQAAMNRRRQDKALRQEEKK